MVDGKECAVLVTGVEGEEACAVAAGKIEEGVEERGWQGRAELVIVAVGNGSSGLLLLLDEVVDGMRRLLSDGQHDGWVVCERNGAFLGGRHEPEAASKPRQRCTDPR